MFYIITFIYFIVVPVALYKNSTVHGACTITYNIVWLCTIKYYFIISVVKSRWPFKNGGMKYLYHLYYFSKTSSLRNQRALVNVLSCPKFIRSTSFSCSQVVDDLIRSNTRLSTEHLTPEIKLHLITPACNSWNYNYENTFLEDAFWGFYWPGGQAINRYLLDNHTKVKNKVCVLNNKNNFSYFYVSTSLQFSSYQLTKYMRINKRF